MATDQNLQVLRVNHREKMTEALESMFLEESLCDVTICCSGQQVKAHRVILAASSIYFKEIFAATLPGQYPIVFVKSISIADLNAILEFIYKGEVTVPQTQLESLVSSAETLGVMGLGKINLDEQNFLRDTSKSNNATVKLPSNVSKISNCTNQSSSTPETATQSYTIKSNNIKNDDNINGVRSKPNEKQTNDSVMSDGTTSTTKETTTNLTNSAIVTKKRKRGQPISSGIPVANSLSNGIMGATSSSSSPSASSSNTSSPTSVIPSIGKSIQSLEQSATPSNTTSTTSSLSIVRRSRGSYSKGSNPKCVNEIKENGNQITGNKLTTHSKMPVPAVPPLKITVPKTKQTKTAINQSMIELINHNDIVQNGDEDVTDNENESFNDKMENGTNYKSSNNDNKLENKNNTSVKKNNNSNSSTFNGSLNLSVNSNDTTTPTRSDCRRELRPFKLRKMTNENRRNHSLLSKDLTTKPISMVTSPSINVDTPISNTSTPISSVSTLTTTNTMATTSISPISLMVIKQEQDPNNEMDTANHTSSSDVDSPEPIVPPVKVETRPRGRPKKAITAVATISPRPMNPLLGIARSTLAAKVAAAAANYSNCEQKSGDDCTSPTMTTRPMTTTNGTPDMKEKTLITTGNDVEEKPIINGGDGSGGDSQLIGHSTSHNLETSESVMTRSDSMSESNVNSQTTEQKSDSTPLMNVEPISLNNYLDLKSDVEQQPTSQITVIKKRGRGRPPGSLSSNRHKHKHHRHHRYHANHVQDEQPTTITTESNSNQSSRTSRKEKIPTITLKLSQTPFIQPSKSPLPVEENESSFTANKPYDKMLSLLKANVPSFQLNSSASSAEIVSSPSATTETNDSSNISKLHPHLTVPHFKPIVPM